MELSHKQKHKWVVLQKIIDQLPMGNKMRSMMNETIINNVDQQTLMEDTKMATDNILTEAEDANNEHQVGTYILLANISH